MEKRDTCMAIGGWKGFSQGILETVEITQTRRVGHGEGRSKEGEGRKMAKKRAQISFTLST